MNAISNAMQCSGPNANECLSCNYNSDGRYLQESTHECVIDCEKHWYSNLTDWKVNCLLNYSIIFSAMNVIANAMNAVDLIRMNAYHVIIIVMVVIYRKVHMSVLLIAKTIGIQI